MKIFKPHPSISFPFEKYCYLILDVVPEADITGIDKIQFTESFSHPELNKNSVACYFVTDCLEKGVIEINFRTLLHGNIIPRHLFVFHREIAALFLSKIICHEIGHHVYTFNRTGLKKNEGESFADEYARAGYFKYLKSRKEEILSTYDRAIQSRFLHDKPERDLFKKGRAELLDWLREKKNGISFP